MDTKKIKKLLLELDKIKKRIAIDRDKLRSIVGEIEDLERSLTDGIDGFADGLRFFQDALDDMSKFI